MCCPSGQRHPNFSPVRAEVCPSTLFPARRKSIVPKVGLEPTRVLPHRILSPARLPFRHFGYVLR